MSGCQKCNTKIGIMIEDDHGKLCIACHPTAICTELEPYQNLGKLKNIDLKNTRERIYS